MRRCHFLAEGGHLADVVSKGKGVKGKLGGLVETERITHQFFPIISNQGGLTDLL